MPKKTDATPEELADLEKKIESGEWLRMGDAATLLGVSRTKMHTLVTQGIVGRRVEPGGRWRRCNPTDIKRLLDESRRELRGEHAAVTREHTPPASSDR